MSSATSSLACVKKPKAIELNKKAFNKLFKLVSLTDRGCAKFDRDYYEVASIIDWFNHGAGTNRRFDNYRKSSSTKTEVDRWCVILTNMRNQNRLSSPETIPTFVGMVLEEDLIQSGETGEGIYGRSSGKIHRALMPHFLDWLSKGTLYALSAWWQICNNAPKPEPPPLQLRLELRESSKEVRRSLTDLYKNWWDAHPGESKAPNFGTYLWQRENQLMQALFGKSITALKADRSLTKDDTLRDFLPAEWLELLSQAEESIALLLEADIPPKQAIESAVKSVGKRNSAKLLACSDPLPVLPSD